ncbi:MAG: hypothetical protein RJA07_661 [Bacteroidota bacterium]
MKKYIPILTILLMLAAIACTKFKDDSFISFRKPEKRLLGNWKIVAFEVDGIDSLSNLYTYADFSNCNFHFYRDVGNSTNKVEGCINEWTVGWYFEKQQFTIANYFIYPQIQKLSNGIMNATTSLTANVLKLYKNDFWVQKSFNNKTYIIKFKKQ